MVKLRAEIMGIFEGQEHFFVIKIPSFVFCHLMLGIGCHWMQKNLSSSKS